MTRVLSVLVFAAVVVGILLIPPANSDDLAANHAGGLADLPARLVGAAEPGERPFWRYVTEGSAAERREDGSVLVRVRGYRMPRTGQEQYDPILSAVLFKSIKRQLRSIAAREGFQLDFEEVPRADYPGASFFCERMQGGLRLEVELPDGTRVSSSEAWYPSSNRSLLPPLVAIGVAILLRNALLALLSGVVVGAVLARAHLGTGWSESLAGGLLDVPTRFFWNQFIDPERAQIILFVVFMLSMVGVLTRSGGIRGLMDLIARIASGARRTQVASWLMGLAVFFDDYANTILVGSTMRPLSDRFRVAREKLAYIVDSTAAPVAGISIFSTWIAFEVSTFSAQLPDAALATTDGYSVFLQTLPYRFYCLLTIFFVGLIVLTGRDYGSMLRAERRARAGKVLRDGARPMVSERATRLKPADHVVPRASVALWPLGTFVGVTLLYIFVKGGGLTAFQPEVGLDGLGALFSIEGMTTVLFDGSGSDSLACGALVGLLVAVGFAWTVGLGGADVASAAWASLRSMGIAILILYLAWMIGAVCISLGTAEYISVLLGRALNPLLLPGILFALAGVVAFSTGSSWSTMSILLPLVVGLAYELGSAIPLGPHGLLVISIGAVLEGAIFGDHCSPISDTTVMSSIASASDHVDHVRTQAPYALTTMAVALLLGYFPAVMYELHPALCLLLGAGALTAIVLLYGKRVEDAPRAGDAPPAGDPVPVAQPADVPVETR